MDVYVHEPQVQLNKQHARRKLPDRAEAAKAFLKGGHKRAAFDIAAVDEKVLHIAVGTADFGFSDIAVDAHAGELIFHRQHG